MKILVTGSAGFIGFSLASKLLAEGHDVVGFDNFNNYYSVELKRARNAILETAPNFTLIKADLADNHAVTKCFEQHSFEKVCHLAAQAGVRHSITNPFAYHHANLTAFLNILEACRHSDTKRLVYASSSSVYGGNTKLPFSESDRVDSPISLYAATKRANELMAHSYSHLYGLQTAGLRFFTVYGPWGRPDMALWLFTKAMIKGDPINVFNGGNMSRDFTYIDDIVSGINGAIFSEGLDPYEIFNLGNHKTEKLTDMIDMISNELNIKPKMNLLPMQPGDVEATYADIEKAQNKLGFQPLTPISVGIPNFIKWYTKYHGVR